MLKKNIGKIAIVGATGNVGRQLVRLFMQRHSNYGADLQLFASAKSAGMQLQIEGGNFPVQNVDNYDFKDCRLAIFTTESDVSKKYIPVALASGTRVIDASSAYRLDPNVPLIVPPVNAHLITETNRLFAHANCLASPIAVVLKPLHEYAKAKRVLISTYQSVSGAGKGPMNELDEQLRDIYTNKPLKTKYFPQQIALNIIPQVSDILEDGFSYEEFKIIRELQKIISAEIKISATAVRVPVMIGHGISLAVEFTNPIELKDIRDILSRSPGIQISQNDYTTPLEVVGKDDVYVGRIRRDNSVPHGVLLWLVSDNLRRGAALDAVEIAEKILAL